MKIISKYKDGYDNLAGIYGEDTKLILDRREGRVIKELFEKPEYLAENEWFREFRLAICGNIVNGMVLGSNVYYFGELELVGFKPKKNHFDDGIHYEKTIGSKCFQLPAKPMPDTQHLNKEHDCPILYLKPNHPTKKAIYRQVPMMGNHVDQYECIKYPRLSDFKIEKVYSSKALWIMLSDWLGKRITENEPTVPIGDDDVRIQSHGFDARTSFRPKMKDAK